LLPEPASTSGSTSMRRTGGAFGDYGIELQMSDPKFDWQDDELEVVVNIYGQYSIWPAGKTRPAGWTGVGKTGSKADCLEFIEQHWTDMRPHNPSSNQSRVDDKTS
jgi:MbtH protein